MAKPSKASKKPQAHSSTRKTGKDKKKPCCNVLEMAMRGETQKTKRPAMKDHLNCQAEMPSCPTGVACLFGRDASGELMCLPAPDTGTKAVKADPDGFFLANPDPEPPIGPQAAMRQTRKRKRK